MTFPEQQSRPQTESSSQAPVKIMAVLLVLLAAALLYVVYRQQNTQVASAQSPAVTARPVAARGDLAEDEQGTIKLFHKASPSVVHVTNLVTQRRSMFDTRLLQMAAGTGSGFMWDTKGHIVTNFHVVQNGSGAKVTLADNTVWNAKVVGVAPEKDLAVLKIDAPASALTPLAIGTSQDLQVGQKVFAIGNPFGLDQTLTTGVIGGLGREIHSVTKHPIQGVIQTDAAINPGNSGGPLLDSSGRLIGVNTAIYNPTGAGSNAGIGFAVPANTVNRIVPQLVRNGKVVRAGLGIALFDSRESSRSWRNITGAVILEVFEGSVAEKAGLSGLTVNRGYDGRGYVQAVVIGDIIVAIDGKPIKNEQDAYRALDRYRVGDSVQLKVMNKQRQEREVNVRLQAIQQRAIR